MACDASDAMTPHITLRGYMPHIVSYSTAGFSDRPVEAALDEIAAAGFRFMELLGQEPHVAVPPTGTALAQFKRRLAERGLSASTVHAPLRENVLGAPDEEWRRDKVRVLSSYIHFAGEVGAAGLVIHPVPNPIFVHDAEHPAMPARIQSAVHRSLDELAPLAHDAGVRLLLENLPYQCDYPYLTMTDLRTLVDGYPADDVGLVIDTGHAWVLGNRPQDEIRAAGSRLWGTHLQDVAHDMPQDSHWAPTHGDLDWSAIRTALIDIHYAGAWTFEVQHARHGESLDALAEFTFRVAGQWGLNQ
jgi:sugar phosphate isomerase/epimerase